MIPIVDEKGKTIGQVVYTAYIIPDCGPSRPVTFAFNGGPGAASAFLNFGALGPKRAQFESQGDAPSDRPMATDNPNSWLDFTDLVFIDPVGIGLSRSFVDADATQKAFYAADPDIHYLSRVIFDWLVKAGRMTSPKYLIGEATVAIACRASVLSSESDGRGPRRHNHGLNGAQPAGAVQRR